MINDITQKLASNYAALSPTVQDVVNRVRTVGLHKVAAQLRNKQDFGLEDAISELSVKLAYEFLKQQKIASGLNSLRDLHKNNTVKLSGLLRIGPHTAEDVTHLATKMRPPKPPMPGSFGAAKGVEGPLTAARPARMGFPATTEAPGINKMPTR